MAQEIIQNSYYHSLGDKWLDINVPIKVCIENFLAELLFKKDLGRVIFSPSDAIFRRRIEMLDTGKAENQTITPVSLDLPFAAYAQTSDWVEDDRGATQNAGQAIFGTYNTDIYRRIRSLACKADYKFQIFFNRRDDVRTAQQLLYWEQSPKQAILLYATYTYKGHLIAVPAFLTINSINTSPDWTELDFLSKQRIFPIEVTATVRSYQTLIDNVDNIIALPIRFSNFGSKTDDGIVYITEETSLEFALSKFDLDGDVNKVNLEDENLNAAAKLYFEGQDYTEAELKKLAKTLPNDSTYDIIKGYYSETTEVNLNAYAYMANKSTSTSAYIAYKVKPADYKYFQKIVFKLPGHDDIVVTDCKQTSITINDLYPNSTYKVIIMTYSTSGNITTFTLSFTTKADANDEAPTTTKINAKLPGLVGMTL